MTPPAGGTTVSGDAGGATTDLDAMAEGAGSNSGEAPAGAYVMTTLDDHGDGVAASSDTAATRPSKACKFARETWPRLNAMKLGASPKAKATDKLEPCSKSQLIQQHRSSSSNAAGSCSSSSNAADAPANVEAKPKSAEEMYCEKVIEALMDENHRLWRRLEQHDSRIEKLESRNS